jgi:MFS transporter, MHS family, proline/betaine transporter
VFGVGFVVRPIGAVAFGVFGDRYGRRLALSAVIFLMAFSTFVVGLLPSFAAAGLLGPVLLVVARLAQGLSAGGEWGGATAYIVEFAGEGRRGYIGSWQQVSVGAGFLLGSLAATLLTRNLAPEARMSWGWRVPFLLGILVALLGAYLRWRLDDTPKFIEIEEHGEVAKTPLAETLTGYPRETLIAFGLTLHNTVAYYIALVYIPPGSSRRQSCRAAPRCSSARSASSPSSCSFPSRARSPTASAAGPSSSSLASAISSAPTRSSSGPRRAA